MPEERVEILNPALEGHGRAHRLRGELQAAVSSRRSGAIGRGAGDVQDGLAAEPGRDPEEPMVKLVTAPMPKEMFPRGLLAPSMIAHVLVQKYRWGLPFHRSVAHATRPTASSSTTA